MCSDLIVAAWYFACVQSGDRYWTSGILAWSQVGWDLPASVCQQIGTGEKPLYVLAHVDVAYVSFKHLACIFIWPAAHPHRQVPEMQGLLPATKPTERPKLYVCFAEGQGSWLHYWGRRDWLGLRVQEDCAGGSQGVRH